MQIKITIGGFWVLLTVVFVILKLCNVLTFSWLWVFSPLWLPLGIVFVGLLIMLVVFKIRNFRK